MRQPKPHDSNRRHPTRMLWLRGAVAAVVLAALMFLPFQSLMAAVYYVRMTGNDGNSGTTAAAAWATFAKATSSTGPGDIVYFGAGTYTERVEPSVDGTIASPIRFVADTDGTMTGDVGAVNLVGVANNAALNIDSDNYLEFDGFRITANGKEGVKVKNSAGFVFRNCEVFASKHGVKIDDSSDALIVNCLIRDNSDRGFKIKGSTTVAIWNCTIVDNGNSAIKTSDSVVCTVKNTIIANNTEEGFFRENGTLNHTHNLVYGNGTNYSGTTQDATEIVSDPLFEDAASDDFHLQDISPAIDVGTDATGIVDDDLDRLFRPIGATWEMGCYEYCLVGPLMMVVADDDNPSAQDMAKLLLIQSWGYCVSLIDDDDPQADFDAALANNLVAYVSEEVDATSLASKLVAAKIGVVSEEADLTDEFGFSSSSVVSSQLGLGVVNDTHYITASFVAGVYNIFDSSQSAVSLGGTVSSEVQVLAQWGSANALSLLEIGAKRHDSGTVTGRRVQLPWGGSTFDIDTLNANGQTIMQRAIQWAHGIAGYWTLDETTGTVAYDSSGNANNGSLLGGFSFDSNSVSPAKLGDGLDFDGLGNYVSVTNDSTLQPTDAFSITAWIKGDAWSSGSDVNVILRKGSGNPNNYQLAIADGKVAVFLDDSDSTGIRGDTTLAPDQWYHVAATWDGSIAKIYVDGVLDNAPGVTKLGPIGSDTRPVLIGGAGATDFFDGAIDDVRFYNYALDVTEAKAIKGLVQPKGVRIISWKEIQ